MEAWPSETSASMMSLLRCSPERRKEIKRRIGVRAGVRDPARRL